MRVKIREISEGGLDIVDQASAKDLDLKEEFINLEKPQRSLFAACNPALLL